MQPARRPRGHALRRLLQNHPAQIRRPHLRQRPRLHLSSRLGRTLPPPPAHASTHQEPPASPTPPGPATPSAPQASTTPPSPDANRYSSRPPAPVPSDLNLSQLRSIEVVSRWPRAHPCPRQTLHLIRHHRRISHAQSHPAPHSPHRPRLRRGLHGPRQHQLRLAPDEPRPALQRHHLRLRRRSLLPQLRCLRGPLEPPALPLRSTPLARPHHDHLGPPRHGHALRPHTARSFTPLVFSSAWPKPASSPESSSTSCSGSRPSMRARTVSRFYVSFLSAPSSWDHRRRPSQSQRTPRPRGWQWLFLVEGPPRRHSSASSSSSSSPTAPPTPTGSPNTNASAAHRPHPSPIPRRPTTSHSIRSALRDPRVWQLGIFMLCHARQPLRLHLRPRRPSSSGHRLSAHPSSASSSPASVCSAPSPCSLNAAHSDRTPATATCATSSPVPHDLPWLPRLRRLTPVPDRCPSSRALSSSLQLHAGPALVVTTQLPHRPLRRGRHRRHQHDRHHSAASSAPTSSASPKTSPATTRAASVLWPSPCSLGAGIMLYLRRDALQRQLV